MNFESLSRKQEKALLRLVSGESVALVAKSQNISESTVWRWLQQPKFQLRYRAMRRQLVENAIADLQNLTSEAVETLRRNLSSGHPSSEVRTALGVLTKSLDAIDLMDLSGRIDSIEHRLEPKKTA
jgi:hypothetical protein